MDNDLLANYLNLIKKEYNNDLIASYQALFERKDLFKNLIIECQAEKITIIFNSFSELISLLSVESIEGLFLDYNKI